MQQSERFWNKIAEKYSRTPVSDEASYQKKLSETQAYFSPDMNVLEFGCGTGTTAVHHAPYVHHIDAIDIAENMLEIGRSRARDADIHNITFHQGTLEQFNADTASLDAVLGLNILHLLPDRHSALSEIARILKPGGIFVSSTVCLSHSYLRLIKWLEPIGKLMGLMPDVYVISEEGLVNELIQAGFSIERRWHHGSKDIGVFIIAKKVT
ncbi:class I SAM-dependent methyltransferase [Vibrio hangzhouensis]|uniref:class I SAM-dependent methyltransferase n=1 Tax=Vibrio hangzhouensis TaxID=462991 RepID=UPI001C93B0A4|nr:class I SAM-dependent methyltransferase [Vibrio hangzhouensis]MBY6196170.1 class I SAM-dependent methyltransferase [Vibrio hangzhouensis]